MSIESYLRQSLTALAEARELEATHPNLFVKKCIHRVCCPTCGSDNAHRLWVSFTDRCQSDWHNNRED
jgi:hypothetical protein